MTAVTAAALIAAGVDPRAAAREAARRARNAPAGTHDVAIPSEKKSAGARVAEEAARFGCEVLSFEQRRPSGICACPDMIIWTPSISLWFEAKSPTDKFTTEQWRVLSGEFERGKWCAGGDVIEARYLLAMLVRADGPDDETLRQICWEIALKISARGRRPDPGQKKSQPVSLPTHLR